MSNSVNLAIKFQGIHSLLTIVINNYAESPSIADLWGNVDQVPFRNCFPYQQILASAFMIADVVNLKMESQINKGGKELCGCHSEIFLVNILKSLILNMNNGEK